MSHRDCGSYRHLVVFHSNAKLHQRQCKRIKGTRQASHDNEHYDNINDHRRTHDLDDRNVDCHNNHVCASKHQRRHRRKGRNRSGSQANLRIQIDIVVGERELPELLAARSAGAAPLHQGQPGYSTRLDRGGDGVACE